MIDSVEREPPDNSLHRRLWQMGFDPDARQRIIRLAQEHWWDPVDLGSFITRMSASAIADLKVELPKLAWYDDFLSFCFWLVKMVLSWGGWIVARVRR